MVGQSLPTKAGAPFSLVDLLQAGLFLGLHQPVPGVLDGQQVAGSIARPQARPGVAWKLLQEVFLQRVLRGPETVEVKLLRTVGVRLIQDLFRVPGCQTESHARHPIKVMAPLHLNAVAERGAQLAGGLERLEAFVDIGVSRGRRWPQKARGESFGCSISCLSSRFIDALLDERCSDFVDADQSHCILSPEVAEGSVGFPLCQQFAERPGRSPVFSAPGVDVEVTDGDGLPGKHRATVCTWGHLEFVVAAVVEDVPRGDR